MNVVKNYWNDFSERQGLSSDIPDAWMFGDGSKEMGNELGGLVIKGIKTGTCALKCLHDIENEPMPKAGQYDILLNGENQPIGIIQYMKVEIIPMNEVTEAFAESEGEGDLSYEYWYREHERFFKEELKQYSVEFSPDIELVCQTFQLVDIYRP